MKSKTQATFDAASARMAELLGLVDQERQAQEALESARAERECLSKAVAIGDAPPEALREARQGELAAERTLDEIQEQRQSAGGEGEVLKAKEEMLKAEDELHAATAALIGEVGHGLKPDIERALNALAAAAAPMIHLGDMDDDLGRPARNYLAELFGGARQRGEQGTTIYGRPTKELAPKAIKAVEAAVGPVLEQLRAAEAAVRPLHEADARAHEERQRERERQERSKPRGIKVSTRLPDGRLVDAKGPEAAARKVELDREAAERAARELEANDLRRPWSARP